MSSVLVSVVVEDEKAWTMTFRDHTAANFKNCFIIEQHGEDGQKIVIPKSILNKLVNSTNVKLSYKGV